MKKTLIATLTLLVPLTLAGLARAQQEHPEGHEHPEGESATAQPTADQLADAIRAWVEEEAAAHDGHFLFEHPDTGEQLQLTLDEVHRDRLSQVGEQTYFACADFTGADGTAYDLDIFMEGPDPESLEMTDVTLHKVDGEARYTWYEEDGIWKKRPVE